MTSVYRYWVNGKLVSGGTIARLPPPCGNRGAGIELRKLLDKLGLKPAVNCKCAQHIREMNEKGTEWCEQNIELIIGWLKEEADRAKLPFTKLGARILVKRAIRNARKLDNR